MESESKRLKSKRSVGNKKNKLNGMGGSNKIYPQPDIILVLRLLNEVIPFWKTNQIQLETWFSGIFSLKRLKTNKLD